EEALLTASLQHPAIVPVYDAGWWTSGQPFFSMKMVEGGSLRDAIERARTLEQRVELLPSVIAVADAIAYAHGQRVIHRDLKPSNILIGPFGETVVIDWGLAKKLSDPDPQAPPAPGPPPLGASADLTGAGTVRGTRQYRPPERARGEPVDERCDVYALGAVLYEVLCGAPPYPQDGRALEHLASGPPVALERRQPGL